MNTRSLMVTTEGAAIEFRYSTGGGLVIEAVGGLASGIHEVTDPLDVLAISWFTDNVRGLMKSRGAFGIGER